MKKIKILLLLLLLAFSQATVWATGENYAFFGDDTIDVTNGHLAEEATLSGREDSYYGVFAVEYVDHRGFWKPKITDTCLLSARVELESNSTTRGKLYVSYIEESTEPTFNPVGHHNCNTTFMDDSEGKISNFIANHNNTNVAIDDSEYNTETPSQREVRGQSFSKEQPSPETDTITLQSEDQIIKSQSVELGSIGNEYTRFTFEDVDPGNYQICSQAADECKNITKKRAESLPGIELGQLADTDQIQLVEAIITYSLDSGLTPGEIIPEREFAIFDSNEEIVAQETMEPIIYEYQESTGLGRVNFQPIRAINFTGIEPGDYDFCDIDRLKCVSFTKSASEKATVEMAYAAEESMSLYNQTGIACEAESGPAAWILCPIARNMLEALDSLAGDELQQLLQINASVADNDKFQEAVSGFRNVANGLLAIGFLIVIFGQALSLGIDAYTVKKMLPRVVLAAIAIQLSTPVAIILIDIFNVLGIGITQLILAPIGVTDLTLNFNPFSADTGNLLAGSFSWLAESAALGVGVASAGAALWALILALPTILIIVLITIAMLVLRRLVLVALILIAPLAMAAWVLPNTEKWAKEWFDTFIKILLMFPLIMGIIALGKFLADVNSITTTTTGGPTFVDSIVTLLAAFGPYMLIPFTYQFAGRLFGALGEMAGRVQGKALGGGGGAGGQQGGLVGKWKNSVQEKRSRAAAGQLNIPGKNKGGFLGSIAKGASVVAAESAKTGLSPNKRRAYANAAFNNRVDQAEKEVEALGMANDKDSALALAFESDDKFDEYVEGLESSGSDQKQQKAVRMRQARKQYKGMMNPERRQAMQRIAAKQGAIKTHKDVKDVVAGTSTGNIGLAQQRVSEIATLAGRAGHLDAATSYMDDSGKVKEFGIESLVTQKGVDTFQRIHRKSVPKALQAFNDVISTGSKNEALTAGRKIGALLKTEGLDDDFRGGLQEIRDRSGLDPDVKTAIDKTLSSTGGS